MRYYHITISYPQDPTFVLNNGNVVGENAGQPVKEWSSIFNGNFDSGALNIVVDIPISTYANPVGFATVMIEGISLELLGNASDFSGFTINIDAGMSNGLPLAKQSQHGSILRGQIFQSFGNWQGTEMSLNFVVAPSSSNFVLNWQKGMELKEALNNCFSIAYPNYPRKINIGSYVNNHDEIGIYSSLDQLASFIYDKTVKKDKNGLITAQGVNISIQGGSIIVYDLFFTSKPKQLLFTDFVGQPVWIGTKKIQVKLIMRGDLTIGDTVLLPKNIQNIPGLVLTSANANPSQTKNQMNFNGLFYLSELRHVGNYRASQGEDWVTIVSCLLNE